MGIGVGQCLVCHYERTPEAAAEEAKNLIHELRSANNGTDPDTQGEGLGL
ncbi:hypothetical protein [Streptomyces sp. NPDC056544]